MNKCTTPLLFLALSMSVNVFAFETIDTNTGTIRLNDFRLGGASYDVTLTLSNQKNSAGQYMLAVTGLSPNNNCTRDLYSGASNLRYNINTYTKNGIQVGGIKSNDGFTAEFMAAWSSAPLSTNPFLVGYDSSSLSEGTYGIVGSVSQYYTGFSTGDRIKVVGDPSIGFSITDLTSNSVKFFPLVASPVATQLTCPYTSGTYIGINNWSYSISNLGAGVGAITATGSGVHFDASWSNNQGSVGKVDSVYYTGYPVGQRVEIIDIGENGIVIFPIDKTTSKAPTVNVFIQAY